MPPPSSPLTPFSEQPPSQQRLPQSRPSPLQQEQQRQLDSQQQAALHGNPPADTPLLEWRRGRVSVGGTSTPGESPLPLTQRPPPAAWQVYGEATPEAGDAERKWLGEDEPVHEQQRGGEQEQGREVEQEQLFEVGPEQGGQAAGRGVGSPAAVGGGVSWLQPPLLAGIESGTASEQAGGSSGVAGRIASRQAAPQQQLRQLQQQLQQPLQQRLVYQERHGGMCSPGQQAWVTPVARRTPGSAGRGTAGRALSPGGCPPTQPIEELGATRAAAATAAAATPLRSPFPPPAVAPATPVHMCDATHPRTPEADGGHGTGGAAQPMHQPFRAPAHAALLPSCGAVTHTHGAVAPTTVLVAAAEAPLAGAAATADWVPPAAGSARAAGALPATQPAAGRGGVLPQLLPTQDLHSTVQQQPACPLLSGQPAAGPMAGMMARPASHSVASAGLQQQQQKQQLLLPPSQSLPPTVRISADTAQGSTAMVPATATAANTTTTGTAASGGRPEAGGLNSASHRSGSGGAAPAGAADLEPVIYSEAPPAPPLQVHGIPVGCLSPNHGAKQAPSPAQLKAAAADVEPHQGHHRAPRLGTYGEKGPEAAAVAADSAGRSAAAAPGAGSPASTSHVSQTAHTQQLLQPAAGMDEAGPHAGPSASEEQVQEQEQEQPPGFPQGQIQEPEEPQRDLVVANAVEQQDKLKEPEGMDMDAVAGGNAGETVAMDVDQEGLQEREPQQDGAVPAEAGPGPTFALPMRVAEMDAAARAAAIPLQPPGLGPAGPGGRGAVGGGDGAGDGTEGGEGFLTPPPRLPAPHSQAAPPGNAHGSSGVPAAASGRSGGETAAATTSGGRDRGVGASGGSGGGGGGSGGGSRSPWLSPVQCAQRTPPLTAGPPDSAATRRTSRTSGTTTATTTGAAAGADASGGNGGDGGGGSGGGGPTATGRQDAAAGSPAGEARAGGPGVATVAAAAVGQGGKDLNEPRAAGGPVGVGMSVGVPLGGRGVSVHDACDAAAGTSAAAVLKATATKVPVVLTAKHSGGAAHGNGAGAAAKERAENRGRPASGNSGGPGQEPADGSRGGGVGGSGEDGGSADGMDGWQLDDEEGGHGGGDGGGGGGGGGSGGGGGGGGDGGVAGGAARRGLLVLRPRCRPPAPAELLKDEQWYDRQLMPVVHQVGVACAHVAGRRKGAVHCDLCGCESGLQLQPLQLCTSFLCFGRCTLDCNRGCTGCEMRRKPAHLPLIFSVVAFSNAQDPFYSDPRDIPARPTVFAGR